MNPNKPQKIIHMYIKAPHDHDVITGRGNGPKVHPGNVAFRQLVKDHKSAYYGSTNDEKKRIVLRVIQLVQSRTNPPGRFLTDECGIWKLMGQKNIFRKVGQALREHQGRQEKGVTLTEVNNPISTITVDNPPRIKDAAPPARLLPPRLPNYTPPMVQITPRIMGPINTVPPRTINTVPTRTINVAPPTGQMKMSSNQNFKRGTEGLNSNVQSACKITRSGGMDTVKDRNQQYQNHQIIICRQEMAQLQKEVSLLKTRVDFLEKRNNGSEKPIVNDPIFSYTLPTPSLHIIPNSGISINCQGKSSPSPIQSTKKSFCTKPSLRSFSRALTSSIRGISKSDNVEDALFDILTKSVSEWS